MPHSKRRVQLLNNGRVSYSCEICDMILPLEHWIKLHLDRNHPDREMKEGPDFYSCPFCSEKFTSIFQSRNHRRAFHQGQ